MHLFNYQVIISPEISFLPELNALIEIDVEFGCEVVSKEFQAIFSSGTVSFTLLETYSWLSLVTSVDTATVIITPTSNDDQGTYSLILQAIY